MPITSWLLNERPREKLLIKGAQALSDAELLAILLRIGKKGKTAVDLARDLLQDFDGLRGLLEADQKTLCDYSGVGIAKYVQIQAALELSKRHLQQALDRKDVLKNTQDTKRYLHAHLRHYKKEVFSCLFLDSHNHIICYEELFYGTVSGSAVHPSEVVKKALTHNAAAIILAHNHPSGIATPSKADERITKRLAKALALVEVRVLDHIVVGDNDIVSFAEQKLLP